MRFIRQHKFVAFVSGTVLFQVALLLVALYLRNGQNISLSEQIKTPQKASFLGVSLTESPQSDSNFQPAVETNLLSSLTDSSELAQHQELQAELPVDTIDVSVPAEPEVIEHVIKSGDTLSKIWTARGGSYAGSLAAAKAFRDANLPLSRLRPGNVFHLTLDPDQGIIRAELGLDQGEKFILDRVNDDQYESRRIKPKIVESTTDASGKIYHSISKAASRNYVPYEVTDELVDLFSGRVEFSRDIQPGDSFSVIYTRRQTEDGLELDPGPILAASIQNGGKLLVAVRYTGADGKARYYDENGEPVGNYFLRYPVKFSRISSVFSTSRFHPVLKRKRPHNGVDFAAPTGTPVRAVADGVITMAGYNGGAGKMVKIKHTSKYASAYLHLSKIAQGLRNGARVSRGQVIGAVGSTGLATGPHLHYSFYVNGRYVDPLQVDLPKMPEEFDPIPPQLLRTALREIEKTHETIELAAVASDTSVG